VFARDVERLSAFYKQVVEMDEVLRDSSHAVLDTAGFQLVMHVIPQHIADPFTISTPPQIRDDAHQAVPAGAENRGRSRQGGGVLRLDR